MGKPKVDEQEPTAAEIAQFEIAQSMWNDYQETAPELQRMYQERVTGMVPDGAGGLVRSGNLLDESGSVRTSGGLAQAGVAQAWSAMDKGAIDPNRGVNRMGRTDLLNQRMASGVSAGINTRIGQQNNMLRGVENVVAMGSGQQTQALNGMQSLAGAAAANAASDANSAFADQSANRYLFGKGLGAVGTYYKEKDKLAGGATGNFPVGAGSSGGYSYLNGGW